MRELTRVCDLRAIQGVTILAVFANHALIARLVNGALR